MMKLLTTACVTAVLAAGTLGLTGCKTGHHTNATGTPMVELMPSADTIYVGEIVTVVTQSKNTLNRDAKIKWSTSGGDLKTEQDGRVARVKFDKAGEYTITAQLVVDGNVSDVKMRKITVKPL